MLNARKPSPDNARTFYDMEKQILVTRPRTTAKASAFGAARLCARTFFLAAAGLVALPGVLDADVTVPLDESWLYGEEFDASSGVVTVPVGVVNGRAASSSAVVKNGDIAPNTFVINGPGLLNFASGAEGALQIGYNALVTGNVIVAGESSISTHVTGYTGSVGSISGSIIGRDRLTVGFWDIALNKYLTQDDYGVLPNSGVIGIGARPPSYDSESAVFNQAWGTLVLLGANDNFKGSVRVAPFTTLQIGNGAVGAGAVGGLPYADILLTSDKGYDKANVNIGRGFVSAARLVVNHATSVVLNGVISGHGGITKHGAGTLFLTNPGNTFLGDITIERGTVDFSKLGSLGTLEKTVNLHSATFLSYSGAESVLDLGPDFLLKLVDFGRATLRISNSGTEVRLYRVEGAEGRQFAKEGDGKLILVGDSDNTGAGLYVSGGRVELGKSGSAYAIGAGGLTVSGGTVTITGNSSSQFAPSAPVVLDNGTVGAGGIQGKLDLNGHDVSLGSLSSVVENFATNVVRPSVVNLGAGQVTLAVGANGGNTRYSGTIDGNINLVKEGRGTLILSANNTYAGTTTVSEGTLQIGNGGATGSAGSSNSPIDVNLGGTFAINRSGFLLFDRLITGGGGFTKGGANDVSLTAGASYTGVTTISAGSLTFPATAQSFPTTFAGLRMGTDARLFASGRTISLGGSAFSSQAGHALGASQNDDIVAALVSINNSHSFSVGARDEVSELGIQGSLALNSGTLAVTLRPADAGLSGTESVADIVRVSGDVTVGTSFSIEPVFTDGVRAGEYKLITWAGSGLAMSDAGKFDVIFPNGMPETPRDGNSTNYSISVSGNDLLLRVTGEGNHILTWNNGVSGKWEAASGPDDSTTPRGYWTDRTASENVGSAFFNYDLVRFDDFLVTSYEDVPITGVVRPSRISIETEYPLFLMARDAGKIVGSTGIIKKGSNDLGLRGANEFTGVVDVRGGRVILYAAGATPAEEVPAIGDYGVPSAIGKGADAATILLNSGATLAIDRVRDPDVYSDQDPHAAGAGVGLLVRTNRSFTLGVNVDGSGGGSGAGGRLELGTSTKSSPRLGLFEGTGQVYFAETEALSSFSLVTLGLGGSAGAASSGEFSTNPERGGGVMKLKLTELGLSSGQRLALVKDGAGAWFIQNDLNDYTGGTTIRGGILGIKNTASLGRASGNSVFLAIDGGTLVNCVYDGMGVLDDGRVPSGDFTSHSLEFGATQTIDIGQNGAILEVVDSDKTVTINAPITGGVAGSANGGSRLIKTGTGTLRIGSDNSANGFRGGLMVERGKLVFDSSNALRTSGFYGIYLAGDGLDMNGNDLTINKFLNKTSTGGAYSYAPGRANVGTRSMGAIENSVRNTNVTLTIGDIAASETEIFTYSGLVRELPAEIDNGTVIHPSVISITKTGAGVANISFAEGSNFTGPIVVQDGVLRLGYDVVSRPMGLSSSITVRAGAVLDLYGNQITTFEDDVNTAPAVKPTIYIAGRGRTLTSADKFGAEVGAVFTGWSGALTAGVQQIDTAGGTRADRIVLTDSAMISTFQPFTLGSVRGTGDLHLSALGWGGEAGGIQRNSEFKLTSIVTGVPATDSSANVIKILAGGTTFSGQQATGSLYLQGGVGLRVEANHEALGVSGGVFAYADSKLILNNSRAPANGILNSSVPVAFSEYSSLVLVGGSSQEFQYLAGVGVNTLITRENSGSLDARLDLNIPETRATDLPSDYISGAQSFQLWRGKIGSILVEQPSGVDAVDHVAASGTDKISVTKRGPGTYYLSNGGSDYSGITTIREGTLVLGAVLTVPARSQQSDDVTHTFPATGVLGVPADKGAGGLIFYGGTVLRDISVGLSFTDRLFTIIGSGTVTLESSSSLYDPVLNLSGSNNLTSPGLQFTNPGPIAFRDSTVAGVTLVLGGNRTPSGAANKNLFAPALADPTFNTRKLTLRKTGVGEWVISGTNSYTGETLIEEGTLTLGSANALPLGSSLKMGTNGGSGTTGTLRINGFDTTLESLTTLTAGARAIENTITNGSSAIGTPTLELRVLDRDSQRVFNGSIGAVPGLGGASENNNLHLVKTGLGTQVLGGYVSHTGNTEIREGTLALAKLSSDDRQRAFHSEFVFVDSAQDAVAPPSNPAEVNRDAPVFNVEALSTEDFRGSGYYIEQGKTLVAGNVARVVPLAVSVDFPNPRWKVEVDYATDLAGTFHLAGGTLHVGGTKQLNVYIDALGNETVQTSVKDKVATVTIGNSNGLGYLVADEGTISTIRFSFDVRAHVADQDAVWDTLEDAQNHLPKSDLIVTDAFVFDGIVGILPEMASGGGLGYRLEAGTVETPAAYPLIKYSQRPSAESVANLRYKLQDPRYVITFVDNPSVGTVFMNVVASDTANRLEWVGSPWTQWGDPASTGTNFTQAGVGPTSFGDGDHAYFTDSVTIAERRQITIADGNDGKGVKLGAATFQNSEGRDYTIDGPGMMYGNGYLEKLGTGTLFINNINTYTGGTVLGAGRIVVSNDQALSTGAIFLQGGTLSTSRALSFSNTLHIQGESTIEANHPIQLAGKLDNGLLSGPNGSDVPAAGSGVLSKTGGASLSILGDSSDFTGTFRVVVGELLLGEKSNTGFAAFDVAANATLAPLYATTPENRGEVFLGSLAGSGTFLNATPGAKTLVIGGRDTDAGAAPSVFSGTVNENGAAVSLTKVGKGTFVLAGQNVGYTGGTTVRDGILQIGWGGKNGNIGQGDILLENDGRGTFGTLVFDGDRTLPQELYHTISGGGVLEKRNTNTLYLLADNPGFDGKVIVKSGELHIGAGNNSGSIGTAEIVNDGVLVFNRGAADYVITNKISGEGELRKMDSSTLVFIGENAATGATIIYSGTFQIGDGSLNQRLSYDSSNIYLGGSTLDLNVGDGGFVALGADLSGSSGVVRKRGAGTAVFSGGSTLAGSIEVQQGIFQIGDGAAGGSFLGSTRISVNKNAELWFNRAGVVEIHGRIFSEGRVVVQGGNGGGGSVILVDDNEISGDISVQNSATLQIGNGGVTGSFNSAGRAVSVQLASSAKLVYDINGTGAATGEALVLQGGGDFVKRGAGTLYFNSVANHSGGTIVENGRLVLDTARIPLALLDPAYNPNHSAFLAAEGSGVLELRNGATPFPLEAYLRGTGTVSLAADSSISSGTRTTFNFLPVSSPASLSALEVGDRTALNLGNDSYARLTTGTLRVLSGGLLTGQATLSGDLVVLNGGEVRPNTGKATLTVTGNLSIAGLTTLSLSCDEFGVFHHDSIHYRGTANFQDGATLFVDISNLGNDFPETPTRYELIKNDEPWNSESGSSVISLIQTNPELARYGRTYGDGKGGIILIVSKTGAGIWDIPGLSSKLSPDLKGFTDYLDGIDPSVSLDSWHMVSALLDAGDPASSIAAAAPSGLAALPAMTTTSAHRGFAGTRAHLESLRYDRVINERRVHRSEVTGIPEDANAYVNTNATGVLAYITAEGSQTKNSPGINSPTFDHNIYSGTVGLDYLATSHLNFGLSATYNRGHATLHNGGKVDSDNARASIYASVFANDWLYFDVQAYGGATTAKTSRQTPLGRETAKPKGFDFGASAYVGTAVTFPFTSPQLKNRFALTPFVGIEYVHSEADAFSESGSGLALRVTELKQDSLLLRIGTGVNWIKPLAGDVAMRATLTAAFAAELGDDSARLTGRFDSDHSGNSFRYSPRATPEHTFQVSPSIEFSVGFSQTFSLGYTLDTDFNAYTSHGLSASYRLRF